MVACSWSSASPRPGETFTFLRYGARSSMRSRSGVSAYRSSTSIDGLTCVSESITRNPCLIDSRGGPRHGPPPPPTPAAPPGAPGAPRSRVLSPVPPPPAHAVLQHAGAAGTRLRARGKRRVHRQGDPPDPPPPPAVALGPHGLPPHGGGQRVANPADRGRLIDRPRPAALEVVRHVEAIGARVHGDHRALTEPACELGDHALRPQRDEIGRAHV